MDPREAAALVVEDATPTPSEADVAPDQVVPDTDDELTDEQLVDVEETLDDDGEEVLEEADPDDTEDVETYTLTIDGEDHDVSLDELVQSYQIDGAARKRLQEATEVRNRAIEEGRVEGLQAAEAELTAGRQEITQQREQLGELIGLVGPQLFASQVQQPDASLEDIDPIRYLSEMERWRKDQSRIQALQQKLAVATEQQRQQVAAEQQRVMDENRRQLVLKRPELRDPDQQAAFTKNVRVAQEAVGFTSDEVNAFPDHRGLLVLDLLGKYIARDQQGGPTPAQRVVQKSKTPMAPGAVKYKRTVAQKKRRADRDRAKASGDYRDVAKLLVVDKPRR